MNFFFQSDIYDGANGRMMSKDPVKPGLNPYPYCNNDPADYEDSTGEIAHILSAAALGGLFGGGGAALSSIVSQVMDGEKIDWKKVWGSAANGAFTGAAQAAWQAWRSMEQVKGLRS